MQSRIQRRRSIEDHLPARVCSSKAIGRKATAVIEGCDGGCQVCDPSEDGRVDVRWHDAQRARRRRTSVQVCAQGPIQRACASQVRGKRGAVVEGIIARRRRQTGPQRHPVGIIAR